MRTAEDYSAELERLAAMPAPPWSPRGWDLRGADGLVTLALGVSSGRTYTPVSVWVKADGLHVKMNDAGGWNFATVVVQTAAEVVDALPSAAKDAARRAEVGR